MTRGRFIRAGASAAWSMLLALSLMVICAATALAAPGVLDTAFGGSGWVASVPPPQPGNEANAVAVQSDGKIVAIGHYGSWPTYHLLVVRYLSTGAPDSSFGSGGVVDLLIGDSSKGLSIVIQPWDQKIVVAGTATAAGVNGLFAARLCTNGLPDNGTNCGSGGFGTGGSIFLPAWEYWTAVAVQPDHKLLITASTRSATGLHRHVFGVARLCENGALDNGVNCGSGGFGGGSGFVLTPSPVSADHFAYSHGLLVQPDGKIIAVGADSSNGTSSYQFLMVRYCQNGTLDDGANCGAGGFGSGGSVTTAIPGSNGYDWLSSAVLQDDGKIVAAGESGSSGLSPGARVALVRYCPNGQLDNFINCGTDGFGSGGISTLTAYGVGSYVSGLMLQPDGKPIVVGSNYYPPYPPSSSMLLRFTTAGFLDASFGSGGGALTLFESGSSTFNFLNAGAMQEDGRIVVAGRISDDSSGTEKFLVARYTGDGPFTVNATVLYDTGGTISCTPSNPVAYGSQVVCDMAPLQSFPNYYHIKDIYAGPAGAAVQAGPKTRYTFPKVYGNKDIEVEFASSTVWLYKNNSWQADDYTIAGALFDTAILNTDTIKVQYGAFVESGGVTCDNIGSVIPRLSGGWNTGTVRSSLAMSSVRGPFTIRDSCALTIDGIKVE